MFNTIGLAENYLDANGFYVYDNTVAYFLSAYMSDDVKDF